MKRNLKNSCFVVLGFLLVWNLLSCNNIFIFKKTTQVSFNLNIQGLQVAHQKQSSALNNRAAGGDVSQVIISLYQATDPASISENQQLDASKLKHLESITPAVAPDGKVLATFNEVTVGITAVIFVEIYETDPADTSQNLAYKGNSKIFTVQEGENNVEIELTYSLNQYTVQFVLNGGSFTDGKTDSVSVTSGNSVNLTTYQPQYAGHTFGGWYYDARLQKAADSSVTPNTDNTTSGTLTLYAKWEAVSTSINQTVTSFSALKTAITNASGTSKDNPYVIGIEGNLNTEGSTTITVNSHIKLVATGDYTITKTTNFAVINIFTVNSGASLTLGDENAGGTLTIDGGGTAVPSSKSLINVSGSLTLNEKSVLQNSYITSSTHGGAVYSSGGTISINGGVLRTNQVKVSNRYGGAIYLKAGTFSMTSGTFNENSTHTEGGALYLESCSAVSITGGTFENNSVTESSGYGGAIYILPSPTPSTIQNSTFKSNSAYQNGGAIYVTGSEANSSVTIQDCIFNDNSTTNSTARGGALCVANTNGTVNVIGGSFGTNTVNSVEEDIAHCGSSTATLGIGGDISVSDINLTTNSLKIQSTLENAPSEKIKITLNSYSRSDQVITAADGVTLEDEVGKFILADSGYPLNPDGTISPKS